MSCTGAAELEAHSGGEGLGEAAESAAKGQRRGAGDAEAGHDGGDRRGMVGQVLEVEAEHRGQQAVGTDRSRVDAAHRQAAAPVVGASGSRIR